MKPSSRRRVEREIQAIIREDGDRCSLCHAAFPHNGRTHGGVTPIGKAALVGECCRKKLGEAILSGVYVNQDHHDLPGDRPGGGRTASPIQVEQAISGMQAMFEERGAVRGSLARRAGVDPAHTRIVTGESAWKSDDKGWFETHADRSHRLRAVIGDEASSFGSIVEEPMRPGHELQVLVRQIGPGQRMRMPFARNLETPIPDDELALHALFDVVAAREGPAISTADVLRTMAGRRPTGGWAN